MINTIEKNQRNQYEFIQGLELQWSINIDENNRAHTLSKDSEGSHKVSSYKIYTCDDMLELIQFCMINGYYVKAEIIEQVIEETIETKHPVSDGVMSGFADYLSAMNITIDSESLSELEAYCLANNYQFDDRLKGA